MTTDTQLLEHLTVDRFDHGERALAIYYATDSARRREDGSRPAPNDGSRFETWGDVSPNRITDDDVLACTLLSIRIARHSGKESWFTADHVAALRTAEIAEQATELLLSIGPDRDLHALGEDEAVEVLRWEAGAAAHDLYWLVRDGLGTGDRPGRIAVWKLLARKRPALLAVRDNVVSRDRLHYTGDAWWLPWWRSLQGDADLVDRLVELRDDLASQGGLDVALPPLLRVADVVLWSPAPGE